MASGIYIIHNTKNGKVYIGQSKNVRSRWNEHKRTLNKNAHPNLHLQNAWNKYGENSFNFRVLEYCTVNQLDIREQHFLDIYAPKGMCYNTARIVKTAKRQNADDTELIPIYMRGDKEFVAVLKAQAAKHNLRLADYLRKALDYTIGTRQQPPNGNRPQEDTHGHATAAVGMGRRQNRRPDARP